MVQSLAPGRSVMSFKARSPVLLTCISHNWCLGCILKPTVLTFCTKKKTKQQQQTRRAEMTCAWRSDRTVIQALEAVPAARSECPAVAFALEEQVPQVWPALFQPFTTRETHFTVLQKEMLLNLFAAVFWWRTHVYLFHIALLDTWKAYYQSPLESHSPLFSGFLLT